MFPKNNKKTTPPPPSWFEALIISSNTQQADSNAIASSSDKAASEKLRDEEPRGKTALASKSQGSTTRLEKTSTVAKQDKAVDAKPSRKEPMKDDKEGVSEPVVKKKEATTKTTDEELKRKSREVVEKDKTKARHADESANATLHRRRNSVDDREVAQTRKKIEKEIEREPGELIEEVEEPKPKSPRTTREKDTGRRYIITVTTLSISWNPNC